MGVQPLANDFALPQGGRKGHVPVRVMFCQDCALSQLGEVVDPEILYGRYLYCTSTSETMRRHFDRLLKDLISENGKGSLLEVGSNDGLFLTYVEKAGFSPIIGIEPARNLAGDRAIPTICDFFHKDSARKAMGHLGKVDTLVARHVFCHGEWNTFLDAIETVAHPKTLIAIEVPYVADLLRKTEFDSIYSEHTSYLSLKAVVAWLKGSNFHIHSVNRYSIHGGAVLVMLRRNDSGIEPHLNSDEMLAEEHITEQDWIDFSTRAKEKIGKLKFLVRDLRASGKIVSAFGASAKCTVLLNACGFTEKDIAFVTDNSPFKPGKLVPGTQIPIIHEDEMLAEHPDVSIMTAWNFEAEILEKMKRYRERGGKFIVPGETIRIV